MADLKQLQALLNGLERGPRGTATQSRQLGKEQKKILLWLAKQEGVINYEQAVHGGREKEIATLKSKGILWNPKKIHDDVTDSQKSVTSRALKNLHRRGLVVRYDSRGLIINSERTSKKPAIGPRGSRKLRRKRVPEPYTSHVKLTEDGLEAVAFFVLLGKSYREARKALQEAQKAGESDPVKAALGPGGVLIVLHDSGNIKSILSQLYGTPVRLRSWICAAAYERYNLLVQEIC